MTANAGQICGVVVKKTSQCQSKVFFPDDPTEPPQFNRCPRKAVTTRREWRYADNGKGEPDLVSRIVKLCARCADVWDDAAWEKRDR